MFEVLKVWHYVIQVHLLWKCGVLDALKAWAYRYQRAETSLIHARNKLIFSYRIVLHIYSFVKAYDFIFFTKITIVSITKAL